MGLSLLAIFAGVCYIPILVQTVQANVIDTAETFSLTQTVQRQLGNLIINKSHTQ